MTATPRHGAKSGIGASAVALGSDSTPNSAGVRIKALSNNTGDVYVGVNGVTTDTGFPLDAGEEVFIEARKVSEIYVIGSDSNQAVRWIAS